MSLSIIGLCLFAALLELDTTYAFQTLVSRPIMAGPLFGLLTGDVMAGLQVGIFAELFLSDISPLGGIIPPSGVVAVAVPMILHFLGIELYFGFFFGMIAAILYSFLEAFLRKTRFKWLVFLEEKIVHHPTDIKRIIAAALLLSFSMTFVFVSLMTWFSANFLFAAFPYLTPKIHFALRLAYSAVPWIGLTALIPVFRMKAR